MKKIYSILSLILVSAFTMNAQNYTLDFNGGSSYVDVGSLVGNNVRTIECWFKLDNAHTSSSPNQVALIARNDATQFHEFGFSLSESTTAFPGKLVFFRRASGANNYIYSNSATWSAGVWYHAAGVLDPATGMKLYINGSLQTATDPSTTATGVASEMTGLGVWGDAAIRHLDGQLDEVRFWDRALLQTEILNNMCLTLNPASETGLVGYYKFNEGSGSVATDATTNGYNGTIYTALYVSGTNCVTGIDETDLSNTLSTYPNPTSGSFFITSEESVLLVEIINVLGQTIFTFVPNTEKIEVDLNTQGSGIYFVKVKTKNGIGIKKIIKQ